MEINYFTEKLAEQVTNNTRTTVCLQLAALEILQEDMEAGVDIKESSEMSKEEEDALTERLLAKYVELGGKVG